MSTSIRQGFTFERSDLARAKTAAVALGLTTNEWMRRAVRAALDGPKAVPSPALDPAVIERLAGLADKIAGDHAEHEAKQSEVLRTLAHNGRRLGEFADQIAGARSRPATAPAPTPPKPPAPRA